MIINCRERRISKLLRTDWSYPPSSNLSPQFPSLRMNLIFDPSNRGYESSTSTQKKEEEGKRILLNAVMQIEVGDSVRVGWMQGRKWQ